MDYNKVVEIAKNSGVQIIENPNAITTLSDVSCNIPTFKHFVNNLLKEIESETNSVKSKTKKDN